MPKFFIDRPIFAWVLSLLIMLGGILAITHLPVAQYPTVAPPSIAINATYAGASAETVQDTVTSVIEQQMNGIDNLLYMTSSSSASGQSTVTLYFNSGTDPDIAQVQVQNKLQLAMPNLPQTVQQQGITVVKSTRNFLMFFALSSTNKEVSDIALGNFISSSVLDPLRRVTGVGEADLFGTEYGMRIWLNPDQLESYNLDANDIIAAVQAQNTQVPVGQLGARPAVNGQELNVTLQGQSTLTTVKQFEDILLRVNPDGSRVYLRDVARVELGGASYAMQARVDGRPAAAVGIRLAPSANAVATANAVHAKVEGAFQIFPGGRAGGFSLRQLRIRARLHPGSGHDADRSHRDGVPDHLSVPAKFPGDVHSHHRHSGGAAGHVCRHVCAGLFHQRPDDVRHGAGRGRTGGRRHRGGGKRGAHHERGRTARRARRPSRR